jgi:pimeloyl-ACP methyl ester carboxylesterase
MMEAGEPSMWWQSGVWFVLRVALAILFGLGVLLFFMQRDMIYYPMRAAESELLRQAQLLGVQPWLDRSGKRIGWRIGPPEGTAPTARVLIFHGNAGHALHREGLSRIMAETEVGRAWEFFLLEYPGYGSREGKPSEASFHEAAREAFDELLAATPSLPLVLVGESLGTGVASRLAGERSEQVDGVLLLTPFDSLASVARYHYPWFPVQFLLLDRFHSARHLAEYQGPVVFLLAEEDEVVPSKLGKKLAAAHSGPQEVYSISGSDHNGVVGLLQTSDWEKILRFLGEGAAPSSTEEKDAEEDG